MSFYIVKRILMTVLVLLLVVVFLSLLVHIVPGDPATTILGPRATPGLIQKMRAAMDLDKPLYVQIGHFVWNILHGSLGIDAVTGAPIKSWSRSALPHTLILAITSLSLAILFGIPMGVYSATHPNSLADRIMAILSISFTTIPSYVAGLFLLLLFAVELHVLPAMGVGKTGEFLGLRTASGPPLRCPGNHLDRLSEPPGACQPAGGDERNVYPRFPGCRAFRTNGALSLCPQKCVNSNGCCAGRGPGKPDGRSGLCGDHLYTAWHGLADL